MDEGIYEGIHEGKREGMLEGSDALAVSSTVERADLRTSTTKTATMPRSRFSVSQYDISHSPNAASAVEHGQSVSRSRSEIITTTREKIKESNLAMFVLGGAAAVGLHYMVRFIGTLPVVKYFVKRYLWWAEPKMRSRDYLSMLSSGSFDEGEDGLSVDGAEDALAEGTGRDAHARRRRSRSRGSRSESRERGAASRSGSPSTSRSPLSSSSPALLVQADGETGLISLELSSDDEDDDREASQGVDQEVGEPVDWVNMFLRMALMFYQRGLERWLAGLLQPVFDNVVRENKVPAFVQKLKISEFTLDHEAPYFTNMKRRSSRKDSDLTGVVDVRYTGGARMVLSVELGFSKNRLYRLKVPVMVSELDLECKLWIKLRLAPMCPYVGTLSMAFVGPPTIKVQLSPYDRIKLMRIPVIQPFLTKLFTVDLPTLMTLPKRLEFAIPPAVTAVAEAAIGRDAVMRAVATAVLQADALENALVAALPLGPQGAAGGISLPDLFRGELQVVLKGAKNLPVWGFPWQSNPYCRLALGDQAVRSRKDNETSQRSRHRGPVWNQEFQFLVEDQSVQALEIWIMDNPITGRTDVAYAKIPLTDIPSKGNIEAWFDLESSMPAESSGGSVRLSLTYRPFQDDENDSGYREAAAQAFLIEEEEIESDKIIDIKSAADASSRAAVAASAAAAAVAVTKAAAARAAARLSRGVGVGGDGDSDAAAKKEEEKEKEQEAGEPGTDPTTTGEAAVGDKQAVVSTAATTTTTTTTTATTATTADSLSVDRATEDEAMIQELSHLTDSLHHLTDDVKSLNSIEMLQLAEAEQEAVSAMSRGDMHGANEVLHEAALSLERHQADDSGSPSVAGVDGLGGVSGASGDDYQSHEQALVLNSREISGEEKAKMALTAAKAALAALEVVPDVADVPDHASSSGEPRRYQVISSASDIEDSLGAEAMPVAAGKMADATRSTAGGIPAEASGQSDSSSSSAEEGKAPWWTMAAGWVMDRLPGQGAGGDDENDFGDGSASPVPGIGEDLTPEQRRKLPVGDIVIGEDIPLEEIAAEVRKSWKARDVHVETLVRQQLEARQRESELPLLVITSVMATSSAVLLSIVLYRLINQ